MTGLSAFLGVFPAVYLAAAGIAAAAALLSAALSRGRRSGLVTAAFFVTAAVWAGGLAAAMAGLAVPAWLLPASDLLRAAAGCVLLLLLLAMLVPREETGSWQGTLWIALALLCGLSAVDLLFPVNAEGGPAWAGRGLQLGFIAGLGLDVLGLLLVENAFRHGREARWTIKHLLTGLGGLFAFDLFFLADAYLFGGFSPRAALFRPVVQAAVTPLLLVSVWRLRDTKLDIALSREVVLHSTTLLGAGIYLLAVALTGYLLRESDASWAAVAQFFFLFGALIVLVTILLSAEAKARLQHLVSRHLFPLTFDYRREWLRFIDTMARDQGDATLQHRAVRALCDAFECSAGVLYLHSRGDSFLQAARHNWASAGSLLALPAALVTGLRGDTAAAMDLRDPAARARIDADPAVAGWIGRLDDPWLIVPLSGRGELTGIAVLGQPRVPRRLTWEDRDLLSVLAVQVAAHMREDQIGRALHVAQRFEKTGRHFTFIAHDIKNVVSELGLLVRQAERHADRPEFMADAMETVRESVDRMKRLLVKLRDMPEAGAAAASGPVTALEPLLHDFVARMRLIFPRVDLAVAADLPPAAVDGEALCGVIRNLLQNAVEAGGPQTVVCITARQERGELLVELHDNGPGMPPEQVERLLHSPFSSTKSTGFGIGLFQCRCEVEQWGGRLTVDSAVGDGTSVRLALPPASLPLAQVR